MATRQDVIKRIRQADENANVDGIEERGGRVFGTILSDSFRNMSTGERTEWVRTYIRDPLGIKGLNVGILVPLATGEPDW